MASFLDIGLLGIFSVVFTFLLVYSVFWGIMLKVKPLGDKNLGLYAIIALAGAFFVTLSAPARAYIEFVTPWFLALGLVFFFIVMVLSIFTPVKWESVLKDGTARTWIIIFIALIMFGGLFTLFGQSSLEATQGAQTAPPVVSENGNVGMAQGGTATSDINTNVINTIVHPKVLGLLLIFGLSALIVYFLSAPVGGVK